MQGFKKQPNLQNNILVQRFAENLKKAPARARLADIDYVRCDTMKFLTMLDWLLDCENQAKFNRFCELFAKEGYHRSDIKAAGSVICIERNFRPNEFM